MINKQSINQSISEFPSLVLGALYAYNNSKNQNINTCPHAAQNHALQIQSRQHSDAEYHCAQVESMKCVGVERERCKYKVHNGITEHLKM